MEPRAIKPYHNKISMNPEVIKIMFNLLMSRTCMPHFQSKESNTMRLMYPHPPCLLGFKERHQFESMIGVYHYQGWIIEMQSRRCPKEFGN